MSEKIKLEKEAGKETEEKKEPTQKKVEIEPRIKRQLETIAERVGGDFGMKIEIGKAGEGSFFNASENKIVFDPLHVKESPKQAQFVAAHEGGHRAITRGPHEIGLKNEKINEVYSQLGFAFGNNCAEDPADNNWFIKKFEGLKPITKEVYNKMLEESRKRKEPLGLNHPEARQAMTVLGYIPRFVYFGSEIIKYWHQKGFSKEIDLQIKDVLGKIKENCQEYFETIPSSEKTEKETVEKAKQRFLNFYENIWPEMKKIVDLDINDEKLRKMTEKMMDDVLDKLDKRSKKELKQSAKQGKSALEEKVEDTEKEFKKAKKEKDKEKQAKLKEKLENLKKQQDKNIQPLPMDKLSPELKEKLKQIFDKLPKDQQKKIEKQAKESLERLEDKLNKEKQGKLNKDNPKSHKKRKEKAEKQEQERKKKRKEEQELEKARQKAKERIKKEMTEYDRYYKEVKPMISDLYDELKKVFLPQRHPRWKKGHPSGGRLDLLKAMQFEADKSKYTEIWERKTIPKKMDYRFLLLVDLSGSMGLMSGYEKIKETFKGLIVLTEVLNRFGIKNEIIGFSGRAGYRQYKRFKEELNKETRKKVSQIIHQTGGGTPTAKATEIASEELERNKGKDNFLITLTDGGPDSSSDLEKIVEEIREKTNQKLIGLGLGPATEFVEEFYPAAKGNIKTKQLPEFLSQLLEDMIKNPQKY